MFDASPSSAAYPDERPAADTAATTGAPERHHRHHRHHRRRITPGRLAVVVAAVRAGCSLRVASLHAGYGHGTVSEWLARGEGRDPRRPPTPELEAFALRVRQAEAEHELELVAIIRASKDWRAHAWLLCHRFPDLWGDPPRRWGIRRLR